MVKTLTTSAPVASLPGSPDDVVAALPPPGSPERWPWLQRLRRQPELSPDPWVRALESGALEPQTDLLAALADHLDGTAMARLLRWWSQSEPCDPTLPALLVPHRHPRARQALREAWSAADDDPARRAALLPLLGHQRDPADFPLLRHVALEPGPAPLRLAALEGLSRGLSAWPRPALRHTLRALITDLLPPVAEAAVEALARLPEARPLLVGLARRDLDPVVAARLRRRLARLPATPVVLLLHGRAGGQVPPEITALAEALEQRRGAPVLLETLTAEPPPSPPLALAARITLVPLFLLPGGHVRRDVPERARRWRRTGPVRVLPFLGAWPSWQALLREEVRGLAGQENAAEPLLLHHPVEGLLSRRYLDHLAAFCHARCHPLSPPAGERQEPSAWAEAPMLPLVLATSRLTEDHRAEGAVPLLARPALREGLLQLLEELP
ncbi:MAG: CbiX/SirB N-terminal domain-containing protein [Cyanobacteriota bacterium]|nr:CbiX/SirB N-terminal domain-containing protein [Cyanobacteriota bacterium]